MTARPIVITVEITDVQFEGITERVADVPGGPWRFALTVAPGAPRPAARMSGRLKVRSVGDVRKLVDGLVSLGVAHIDDPDHEAEASR